MIGELIRACGKVRQVKVKFGVHKTQWVFCNSNSDSNLSQDKTSFVFIEETFVGKQKKRICISVTSQGYKIMINEF